MTCRNCNNTLSGTEDFCPYCGAAQKTSEIKAAPTVEKIETPTVNESSIFQSEPVYIYSEAPKEKKDTKTKLAITLVSLFLLTIMTIGGLTIAGYFNLAPAFSSLFSTTSSQTESTLQTTEVSVEFNSAIGLVYPDINLKSTLCTVTSEKGLAVRKGPDNSYAPLGILSDGTDIRVTGKSLNNDLWVYIYVPSADIFGWVSASYISESSLIKEPYVSVQTSTTEAE
jgi:hypothetical protein